ncbi:von Willebrand factor type A domain-containing protein [Mycena vulgaris]|nr:von Willebrand factor type A domain-containing protein [Mycena vulgaris]
MSNIPWGLLYSYDNCVVPLPLLHVRASASIKDLAAQVKLTHTYANGADVAIEATYSFPIPARAAVCSFVMIKQDGTRVVGHVREKAEARGIYEAAVVQGQQAALVEQQTPDVFQLAVGNIQPREEVQIEIVYATVLSEDEVNDSARFHLPMHVGIRYGQSPVPWNTVPQVQSWSSTAFSTAQSPFLEIFVNVEAVTPIAKITCLSHCVSTELGPDSALHNAQDLPFSHYARVSLSSEAALYQDFVLTVKCAGLDAPRCVAELHPIHPTVALALTLVPRFNLADLSSQEFIFLIDRSGSMEGQRITAAKRALVVMLRSLPVTESMFQIASFGFHSTMLWNGGGRPYNQATVDEATQHVDGMQADYGGTEIRGALQHCFETRKTDRPTTIFVVTDGEAWDVDGVLNEVKGAVSRAPAHAYLRVSVLGIGNSVSTAMCEGIARVGNGTCMMVGEQETTFTGKIARMLKAARTPMISDISIDWGVPVLQEPKFLDDDDSFVMISGKESGAKGQGKEKTLLDIFDESVDPLHVAPEAVPPPPEVVLSPFPSIQQSPFKIQTLSPGNRLNVYAILQGKTVPKTVTLTGLTAEGFEIRLSVPVTLSSLPNAPDSPPAIHALAARKIVQDLEDGQHTIASSIPDDPDLLARTMRAAIVRLGKLYSISSSHTSFVAVDESSPVLRDPLPSHPTADRSWLPGAMHSAWVFPASYSAGVQQNSTLVDRHRKRGKLPKETIDVLKTWLHRHSDHPYPSEEEKQQLCHATGLTMSQTSNWMINARRRILAPAHRAVAGQAPHLTPAYSAAPAAPVHYLDRRCSLPTAPLTSPWMGDTYVGASTALDSNIGQPVFHTDDAASKETQYLRRRCFNCHTTNPPSWRRSTADSTKIVCNKCGLYERTHLRARPVRVDELRSLKNKGGQGYPVTGRSPPSLATYSDPLEALARLQSFDGRFSLAVLSTIQLTVDISQARMAILEGISDEVLATILAMAFLTTKLGSDIERECWEAMYEKARVFVEAILQSLGASVGAQALEAKAVTVLA